jgi:hypothetical protein
MSDDASKEKEIYYIFIDTNLVRSNKGIQKIFQSQFFENIIILRDFINHSFSDEKEIEIIIPELVARERYYQKTSALQKDFQSFFHIFKEFEHPLYDELFKVYEKLPTIVENFGLKTLSQNKVKITEPFNPKYLDRIISKTIHHEAPFEQNDKGFKDTLIWYSILEYAKKNTVKEKTFWVFFTNDKVFNFDVLKKEFFKETGKEILILKTGGDARIRYYDPGFQTLITHILRDLDTKVRLTDLEINYIKNVDEVILCGIKANPLPINFANLITEDLSLKRLEEIAAIPIIKFLENLNFDIKDLSLNIKFNPLSPIVTVYLRNYKQWFLDILEIELDYDCDVIVLESYPDWQWDIVDFYDNPDHFQFRYGKEISKYLEEAGYGKIDPTNVFFEEMEYIHYE